MSQDSDSDEDRVPKGSMVLNELAQFDEDTKTQQQQLLQDDENLLADEMPQVEFVPDEEEEEPVRIQEEEEEVPYEAKEEDAQNEGHQEPKVQEQLSEQDHEEADEGESVVEQT